MHARRTTHTRRALGLGLASLLLALAPAGATEITEEVVEFTAGDGWVLSGIASYPSSSPGPLPTLLMISGSGLHDADVTLDEPFLGITSGRQKLFRNVARFFSRKGYLVLRYNKRGASFDHQDDRPQILLTSTFADLVDDADRALDALRAHPLADRSLDAAIYGHSEGTTVALRLAKRRDDAGRLILVSAPAWKFRRTLEYQLVERNLEFLRSAADENGDGGLTLDELDRLDGSFGLGSLFVVNSSGVLFGSGCGPVEAGAVTGVSTRTDLDGDGVLGIDAEVEPALAACAERAIQDIERGALGTYGQSLLEEKANLALVTKVAASVLFVHGRLDVQTPEEGVLELAAARAAQHADSTELLLLEGLGHSLSKPNDFFTGDGGLTTLDNPTLNAVKKRTLRRIWRRLR